MTVVHEAFEGGPVHHINTGLTVVPLTASATLHRPTKTDPIVELAASFVIGGTAQALIDWLDGEITLTRDRLVDDLAALWKVVGEGADDYARRRPRAAKQSRPGRSRK